MLGGGGERLRPLVHELGSKPGGRTPGGNKLPLLLLSLFSFLLFLLSLLILFKSRNLSSRFCISNSLPGWLGNYFMKSLSVFFLFKSVSRSKEPTIGFSGSKVDMSRKYQKPAPKGSTFA